MRLLLIIFVTLAVTGGALYLWSTPAQLPPAPQAYSLQIPAPKPPNDWGLYVAPNLNCDAEPNMLIKEVCEKPGVIYQKEGPRLKEVKPALEAARKARLQGGSFVAFKGPDLSTNPRFSAEQAQLLMSWLAVAAVNARVHGDWDECFACLLDLFHLSSGLVASPGSDLVALDLLQLWQLSLSSLLANLEAQPEGPTAEALADFQEGLSKLKFPSDAVALLMVERDRLLLDAKSLKPESRLQEGFASPSAANIVTNAYNRQAHWCATGNLTALRQEAPMWKLPQFRFKDSVSLIFHRDELAGSYLYRSRGGGAALPFVVLDLQAHHRAHILQTALHRYRLDQGKPCEKLSQLVPQFLKEIPADPCDPKQPLHWDGKKIWSVGPDLQDDQGKPFEIETVSGDFSYPLQASSP